MRAAAAGMAAELAHQARVRGNPDGARERLGGRFRLRCVGPG